MIPNFYVIAETFNYGFGCCSDTFLFFGEMLSRAVAGELFSTASDVT